MGALARPGPQLGSKGPPRGAPDSLFGPWFWTFLRDELRPYPGRTRLVLRMVLAATLTMLCIMTFRLPGAAIAAYYTLLLSRERPIATVRASLTVMVCYGIGAAYALLGVLLFADYPLTHFLWVTVSVFLCFYVVRVTTNYVAAAALAFIITIVIPLWDTTLPTAALVVATLWAAGSVGVGLFCTVLVEYLFALFEETQDELQTGLAVRLSATSDYLRAMAKQAGKGDREAEIPAQRVQQLAMVGVSRLRRLALSPDASGQTPERRSTAVSLVGRVVDLAAALPESLREADGAVRDRLAHLADALEEARRHLSRPVTEAQPPSAPATGDEPLVSELERTAALLKLSLSSGAAGDALPMEEPAGAGKSSFFLPDAFTNPDYLMFSLRGCLATMLCYVIYNGIFWRGLSTSLATCIITALTSIGSSRQKQVLRLSGALVGGLFFGIGSQVLILPMLDGIAGFTVLFVAVTAVAAWVGTSSPRLSYGGQQIALAFFLIHLQEYFPQTNLAIARDRVFGVALGLTMMWLVFDTLGSRPAVQVMRDLFATNLRLLAQLAQPWRDGRPADQRALRDLRDKLSQNFGTVNAQADAVLFEVGPSRARDLAVRDRLLGWQPRLRSLFLIEVALLQYRGSVNPKELAPELVRAQTALDERSHAVLETLADGFSRGETVPPQPRLSEAYEQLRDAVQRVYAGQPTARAQGVLAFSANLAEVVDTLSAELSAHDAPAR